MLNALFIKHQDRKEAAAIERRRQFEQVRRQRIFNARQRVIGIDTTALENQLQEKHRLEQEALERKRKFEQEQQRQNQMVLLKHREQQLLRHQLDSEINNFRALCQRPEQSRDFDLFDPNGLKKSLPARIGDDDPRLTVSGAQKFEGEDLSEKQRKRLQMQQQRSWLEQQIREKRQAEIDRVAAEKCLEEAMEARERRVQQLTAEKRNSRNKLQGAISQFNRQLKEQQEYDRNQRKREDEEDNMAEIYNHLTSDILTENPDVAKSSLGSNRIIPYAYKGMSSEEMQQVRDAQEQQRQELQRRQQEQNDNKQTWDKLANQFDQMIVWKDRELNRHRRELADRIKQENLELSDEQKRTLIVYQNRPTLEYFDQFNTTTR
ncbi:RIB43A-like with coiled-coils protein 2 [Topomyia yanbarensis]|uniref:RIB43A-like with coiled-coils protein 2 n=1 Tax=Topomyia yanbarensis TaxID=2498891 RepID=UPI00273CB39E|nr:RIB43A-like with coiled-coils protein 2 [Topomyia yanbarensis]